MARNGSSGEAGAGAEIGSGVALAPAAALVRVQNEAHRTKTIWVVWRENDFEYKIECSSLTRATTEKSASSYANDWSLRNDIVAEAVCPK